MKKKTVVLKEILIDYVGLYYSGVLNERSLRNAIDIFHILLDENVDLSDFIPIVRQMQFDLDMVAV